MASKLQYTLFNRSDVDTHVIDRMYLLMIEHYDALTKQQFITDLEDKDFVGLIFDESSTVQGFTTYRINPKNCGTDHYNVIFSGDTILDKDHWGSQIMMQGWCTSIGQIISSDSDIKWYWYLLSKGHRTYLYLPLFFKYYYPSVEPHSLSKDLKHKINEISEKIYPHFWKKDLGIVKFDQSMGQLKEELAEDSYKKSRNKWIKFFLEKNPGFEQGDELVCLAELHPENMIRSAKQFMIKGMELGLNLAH